MSPFAVVDIGSNSVRLVIYESLSRTPAVVHNEKAICAIGRDMVTRRRLHDDGMRLALDSLTRFRILADSHRVELRDAVATAAARDALNGQEFVRRAEAAWGSPVRILSGEEEARLAAQGVLAGIPSADGLVADLGGGSLDMVTVSDGRTGEAMTLPFGPLRLVDAARGESERARSLVEVGLSSLGRLGNLSGRSLYAVGGVWRSFARVDMEEQNYRLHVLHHYAIPSARAMKLSRLVARLSRKSLEKVKVVSRRRAEALPFGAVVLEELLRATGLKEVVISAYGLREGLLFEQLANEERAKDPLLAFAAATNARISRTPAHAGEMFEWLSPLFSDESDEASRIRRAVCLFSDVGWRRHPDDRALGTFNQVLTAPFAGADHRARALIATAVFHRYSGDEDHPRDVQLGGLLGTDESALAMRIGLAARMSFALSASASGELGHYRLRLTSSRLILEIPKRRMIMAGDPVQKRLAAVATAFGRRAETAVG
ncbi:MAG TPA: Ppx/GppA family phosphatase [Rhizomicrobium sp.]|jgi:exopolyphosphatase/guanosine-5'-triphosphate,3'-diphosphate pyrophosphatase|nr:Ppx/GppA family phosphatase [Rhizomicrobium sp.]